LQVLITAIAAAGAITAAWIAHLDRRQTEKVKGIVGEVHVLVNSQKADLEREIVDLKSEIKTLRKEISDHETRGS
jgi:gas vesicle protein